MLHNVQIYIYILSTGSNSVDIYNIYWIELYGKQTKLVHCHMIVISLVFYAVYSVHNCRMNDAGVKGSNSLFLLH